MSVAWTMRRTILRRWWAQVWNQRGDFGGAGAPPSPPAPPPPPPTKTDAEIQAEGASARSAANARRGRASTILTQQKPGADLVQGPVVAPTLLGGGR